MKLRFTIHYRTAWGESLHVVLSYRSQNGTSRQYNHVMLTEDGELWQLETAALESRQHSITSVSYHYQVENADGEVLRCEWDSVPRTYCVDSTLDYVFPDQWRDLPLPYHLYTRAYATMVGSNSDEEVTAPRLPMFRRTIVFRVSAPQLKSGQVLGVCGSHPAIGSWNTSRYLRMQPMGRGEWTLSVNALGMVMPLEYKYVIIDGQTQTLIGWEEGENRTTGEQELTDGQVLVLYGEALRVKEDTFRAAGVVVPVFSLRSKSSYGVGDFGDLRRFVDWAEATGMKVVQLLPVNDTTQSHTWQDSYPYNIVSVFALHPHYVDLEAAGTLRSKQRMTVYARRRQELNALTYSDYEAVDRVKQAYLHELFDEKGQQVMASTDCRQFCEANEAWLAAYADFTGEDLAFVSYVQYLLHTQLKEAASYARQKGIVLMGDLPIGLNRDSVETHEHPEYFNLDAQTGAPPDAFTLQGQNWGFPTYRWSAELCQWMRRRLAWMEQYFDALRIDHILGFFRIWEIPADAVYAQLGHFSPALPLTVGEIEYFGLPFRKELMTRPFINDKILNRLFGVHTSYVKEHFLVHKAYNLYDLRADYATQRQVAAHFEDKHDENSLWIRDGLMRLIANVLFVEDPQQAEMYHPRIGVLTEPIMEVLSADEKDAFFRLYNNFYYQRHSFYWGQQALKRLPDVLHDTRMMVCAEDLGMLPDCVEPVLDRLRILSLEIQQMPKQQGYEFTHLEANPYRSVCTISTHDMSPLRLWWEESPERRQRYYVAMLQKEGRAPEHLPAHLAEEIIARHLYCPSMLCILSLQDWLAMDAELRSKHPQDERINSPSDPYNRWKYRMEQTIEELLKATRYNHKVRTMITRSKR